MLIILPSRSSRPQVPVCFIYNKALYTSYIAIGGMVKVDFDIFDSQNRFKKLKSFSFDLLLVMTVSDTSAKWLFSLSGGNFLTVTWGSDAFFVLFLFVSVNGFPNSDNQILRRLNFESMLFLLFCFWKNVLKMSLCSSAFWILLFPCFQ